MESLDIVLRRKFLEALRSNEYEQCKIVRHWFGRHCAIGIFELVYKSTTGERKITYRAFGNHNRFIPELNVTTKEIYDKNDSGWTFPQIADYLERKWECETL